MDHLTPRGRRRAASYMVRVNLEIAEAAGALGCDQGAGR